MATYVHMLDVLHHTAHKTNVSGVLVVMAIDASRAHLHPAVPAGVATASSPSKFDLLSTRSNPPPHARRALRTRQHRPVRIVMSQKVGVHQLGPVW